LKKKKKRRKKKKKKKKIHQKKKKKKKKNYNNTYIYSTKLTLIYTSRFNYNKLVFLKLQLLVFFRLND